MPSTPGVSLVVTTTGQRIRTVRTVIESILREAKEPITAGQIRVRLDFCHEIASIPDYPASSAAAGTARTLAVSNTLADLRREERLNEHGPAGGRQAAAYSLRPARDMIPGTIITTVEGARIRRRPYATIGLPWKGYTGTRYEHAEIDVLIAAGATGALCDTCAQGHACADHDAYVTHTEAAAAEQRPYITVQDRDLLRAVGAGKVYLSAGGRNLWQMPNNTCKSAGKRLTEQIKAGRVELGDDGRRYQLTGTGKEDLAAREAA